MNTDELMQQVRRLEILTRRTVTEVFAGEYSSAFKGRGMEFAEVREYQPGDDTRSIDWNVTARTSKPHVKRFIEERELTIILAADMSASGAFGSVRLLKHRLAAELCALLAFAAIRKNDRVGLLLFTDTVERFIPPRKGARHTQRLVRELLAFTPAHTRTSFRPACEHLRAVLHRRSVIFFISDFLSHDVSDSLRLLSRRHELIAMRVSDPREHALPRVGLIELRDAESGAHILTDASSRRLRERYARLARDHAKRQHLSLRAAGADLLDLSTDRPYLHDLIEFFRRRERRR